MRSPRTTNEQNLPHSSGNVPYPVVWVLVGGLLNGQVLGNENHSDGHLLYRIICKLASLAKEEAQPSCQAV
eukprot:6204145-Pleurochrysis_carterae.AAC.7